MVVPPEPERFIRKVCPTISSWLAQRLTSPWVATSTTYLRPLAMFRSEITFQVEAMTWMGCVTLVVRCGLCRQDEESCKSRALSFLLEVRSVLTDNGRHNLFLQFQETLTAFNTGAYVCVGGVQGQATLLAVDLVNIC